MKWLLVLLSLTVGIVAMLRTVELMNQAAVVVAQATELAHG